MSPCTPPTPTPTLSSHEGIKIFRSSPNDVEVDVSRRTLQSVELQKKKSGIFFSCDRKFIRRKSQLRLVAGPEVHYKTAEVFHRLTPLCDKALQTNRFSGALKSVAPKTPFGFPDLQQRKDAAKSFELTKAFKAFPFHPLYTLSASGLRLVKNGGCTDKVKIEISHATLSVFVGPLFLFELFL